MIYKETSVERSADSNFSIANFSLALPSAEPVKAVVVMTPGSNGDGRDMIKWPVWERYAHKHNLALVGCHLSDKQPSWIETYVNVKDGSGAALLSALNTFGLNEKPLLLWGFSAGGEFNYELACWLAPQQPKRIRAFVVNKGGIYYTALAPQEARDIPAIFFTGGRDDIWRQRVLSGIFTVNHIAGCEWKEHIEKSVSHMIGVSQDMTMQLFDRVLEGL